MGGDGLALPAGHCSLMNAETFFMTVSYSRFSRPSLVSLARPGDTPTWQSQVGAPDSTRLGLLDLPEVQLDRRGAPEDGDQHANLLLLRLDLFDRAGEVGEGALDHADRIALFEVHPR